MSLSISPSYPHGCFCFVCLEAQPSQWAFEARVGSSKGQLSPDVPWFSHRLPGFRQWNLHSEDCFWVFLGHLFTYYLMIGSIGSLNLPIFSRHQNWFKAQNLHEHPCFYWTRHHVFPPDVPMVLQTWARGNGLAIRSSWLKQGGKLKMMGGFLVSKSNWFGEFQWREKCFNEFFLMYIMQFEIFWCNPGNRAFLWMRLSDGQWWPVQGCLPMKKGSSIGGEVPWLLISTVRCFHWNQMEVS